MTKSEIRSQQKRRAFVALARRTALSQKEWQRLRYRGTGHTTEVPLEALCTALSGRSVAIHCVFEAQAHALQRRVSEWIQRLGMEVVDRRHGYLRLHSDVSMRFHPRRPSCCAGVNDVAFGDYGGA